MFRSVFLTVGCILLPFSVANAEGSFGSKPAGEKTVQISSIFTNDFLGDGDDRWRTGSLDISLTFGGGDLRELPTEALKRFQFRVRSEIIAPANLTTPSATDRRYAGVLGFGLFTHYQKKEYDIYYGGELVFVGKSTGLGSLQKSIHKDLNDVPPSAAILADQIPNEVLPTLHLGVSRSFRGARSLIRPFIEAQTGAETFVRLGADAIFGTAMINDFLLRDSVSGQLVSHSKADNSKGFGFLVGADTSYVSASNYLPENGVRKLENFQSRVRAGLVYQTPKFDAFYGVSWLGKEFESQPEGQVVGSLNFRLSF